MDSKLHKLLSTILFLSTILRYMSTAIAEECQYPCYPPPTGPGNNSPVATTPPSPPGSTTPEVGYVPYNPPSTYFGNGVAPPPPEPMLPWFPFYYKKPPHEDQSPSTALRGSTTKIIIFPLLVLVFSFVFH
ncbi:proline-rich receptor-like protein kinase PERK1 [Abeliophyllum distichum]|uniref:Proline-rich receptor-like protein kinase PERK1 n=1 Tax=Abeliophyllum distichum TaxID=126358 RepID=A0ABD1R9G3_9LAMI